MHTINLAYEMRETPFKINAACPGYTKNDFTDYHGREVEADVQCIVKFALVDQNGLTGKFFSKDYNPESGE